MRGRRDRHFDGEARAAPGNRAQHDRKVQDAGDAFDDGKSKAEPARHARRAIETAKLLKDRSLALLRNSDAGVVDVNAKRAPVRTAANQNAAVLGVFDRVRYEVLKQAKEQSAVRAQRA